VLLKIAPFTVAYVTVMVVFLVTFLPFLGTIVTETVQRPFRTARILVFLKAQYRVPFTMLMRSFPREVLGIVIDTALAILDALTLRPRRRRNLVIVDLGGETTVAVCAGVVVSVTMPSAIGGTAGTVVDVVDVVVVVVVVVVEVVVVVGTTLTVFTTVAVDR
jgi:hypothetical protein